MCEAMAAAAEREFEVYERELARLRAREILAESTIDALRADLARALPIVEAAEALVNAKNGIVRQMLPAGGVDQGRFDALARELNVRKGEG